MTKDDRVTVPLMPHLGTGVVEWVIPQPFDRIVVRFTVDGKTYREDFSPCELEPAHTMMARTPSS